MTDQRPIDLDALERDAQDESKWPGDYIDSPTVLTLITAARLLVTLVGSYDFEKSLTREPWVRAEFTMKRGEIQAARAAAAPFRKDGAS